MAWKFYSADGSLLTKVPSASTATEATNVTVTQNDSENADLFPVFVDAVSGTQGIEADAGLTYNPSTGLLVISGELDAGSLDISGNADIDGTLEADAITVDSVTLAEYISDTVGGMVTGNTETNIAVTYEDGDNTLDFVIGTLNQDTTGTAAIATTATVSANNTNDETVYPVFVDAATGNKGLETDTGLNYNPSTGVLTVGSVAGAVTGSSTQITVTAVTDDDTVYPVFVTGSSGANDPEVATALTYNPSTGLLSTAALTLTGNLTVGGTTTTINSTTLTVDDKNIEMGSVGSPDDTTADGGGLTLKGASDKTIIWDNANDNWTSNQHWNIATGLSYKINNVVTLSATALGSAVVGSSLTSVGTLSSLTVSGTGASSITSTSGAVSLVSQSTSANGILLHANGGASESIKLHSDQGTSATSINLVSDAGGITLDVPDGKLITLDGATVFDDEIAVAYNSGNPEVDCTKGNKFNVAMTGNVTTLFFTNPGSTVSGNYMVRLIHDGGARTIGNYYHTGGTTKVHFSAGAAPTLTAATDAEDILSLYWDGAAFHATIMLDSKAYS